MKKETAKTIVNEWRNEIPGMEWQLIRMTRIVDKNGILVDGWNEFIDTRNGGKENERERKAIR